MKLTINKTQAIIALVLSGIGALGYATDALNYYQPRAEALEKHAEMSGWSELDAIKNKIEIIELKIQRIADRAELQERPLSPSEVAETASLREEIRLLNNRRNALLAEKQ